MNSQEFANRREHRRFEVRPECRDRITATIRAREPAEVLTGTVSDLSLSGTKLMTDLPFAVDTPLEITLTSGNDCQIISGVVRWATRGAHGRWYLGCLFDVTIDIDFFNRLAINGILERRRHPRQEVLLKATARRELGSRELIPVQIVDYSDGGLCLISQEQFLPGDRMMIALMTSEDTTSQIVARSEWSDRVNQAHRVGCSFLKPDSCARLRRAVDFAVRPGTRKITARALATWLGLGLVSGWSWMVWNDRWSDVIQEAQVLTSRVQETDPVEVLQDVRTWVDAHLPRPR